MIEKLITIIVVAVALAWVGYSLYRIFSGKGGCSACQGCSKRQECSTQNTIENTSK